MKIALVQIESLDGDIDANIPRHLAALRSLRAGDAGLVVFPELSLTNYQPAIAAAAAITADDPRLLPLEDAARELNAGICVGAPLESTGKPSIAAILLSPAQPRRILRKAYLHEDETPFFAPGVGQATALAEQIALAICYDIEIDAHFAQAAAQGMKICVASVAKTVAGVAAARQRLAGRARQYALPMLMVNSVGRCEGKRAGGGSMVIGGDGEIIEALDGREQAILIYDSVSGKTRSVRLDDVRQ